MSYGKYLNRIKESVDYQNEKNNKENESSQFDIDNDPDWPADAVKSNVIVEEIEINGNI